MTTDIEKENLEAHVELCAERYRNLDRRLNIIEVKVESILKELSSNNKNMQKVIIGATGTIIAGLLSTIVTFIVKIN